ncbi:MAG: class I SAM-dependent methyltransferase [Nitrososphaerota archaeon]|nr:class I SAM-dependent methyltransferase [Nitrososphaerota archaeon]
MVDKILQYGELAKYYDVMYSWKDYRRESEVVRQLVRRYKRSRGRALLDVGCGTGKHLEALAGNFDCVGVDSSRDMLGLARQNVAGVEFVLGDMETFDLGREFDVVLCLFSAVGHVKTYPRLARTLHNFARHLRPGGVAIIEPWFTRATFKDGHVHVLTQGTDDFKVVRVSYATVERGRSVLDMRIVVAEGGKGMKTYRDRMVMGLFEVDKFLDLMRKAGMEARYLKRSLAPGRGLYLGVRRTEAP